MMKAVIWAATDCTSLLGQTGAMPLLDSHNSSGGRGAISIPAKICSNYLYSFSLFLGAFQIVAIL